ncbi:hypothetical protein Q0590_21640 [Rhodocytophaga aerolata]|uniref:Uncharacterized protein n=1 Tax=Rhodocytophaga aerolata TaxID=455078 RepID=A0ABT8R9Y1_9BACT|nr:hypothetical protein [Rhodocytophaga aerolata]MDO1448896.1 hypothetical protein [Rhodocytophaga aerolata]
MLNEVTLTTLQSKEYLTTKYASISFIPASRIAICTVNTSYIPITDFKETFSKIGELIKKEKITKFIFDKRKMTIFHQPSMEWYHLIWKEEMYKVGLASHRKLLPNDKLFEQSVITGRKKIARDNPDFIFEKFDIRYCTSIEEAISK